jgi:translation initiation factor eIF-2B subunit epsilon
MGYNHRAQRDRSKDILSRWVFPLVPNDNHPSGHIYEHTRGNRYMPKDHTVVLAR